MSKHIMICFAVLFIILFTAVSCDRYESEFLFETVDEFTQRFEETANKALQENDITPLLAFYPANYNNDGFLRDDVIARFSAETWTDSVKLTIERIDDYDFLLILSDKIELYGEVEDYYEEWEDQIERLGRDFYWSGYTVDVLENPQQVVIVQSLTYLSCNSCPTAKKELKKIEKAYPENVIILSYHVHNADPLRLYDRYAEERMYFVYTAAPHVIIQGQYSYVGITNGELELYRPQIRNIIEEAPELTLSAPVINRVIGRTIDGSVVISFDELDPNNLYLYYAVIAKETEYNYMYGGAPRASNVVRGRDKKLLENLISDEPVEFSLLSGDDIGDDFYLVLWVHRIANIDRIQDSDKILNAVKIKI